MTPLILAAALALAPVQAFEYRETAPASLFPSGSAIQDTSLPDTVSNPALLPFIGAGYISAAGSKPYSLPDMESYMVRCGFGGDTAAAQASWSRFGTEGYLEQIFWLAGGVRPFRIFSVGAGLSCSLLSIKGEGTARSWGLWDGSAALAVAPFRWLCMTFRQDNILSMLIRSRRDVSYPQWSAGVALRPLEGVEILYSTGGTAFGLLNSISLSARVFPFLCLSAGYQRETGTGAGAITLLWGRGALSYGFRYHAELGMTHSLSVTLTFRDRVFASIQGGRQNLERPDPGHRVDINSCDEDALRGIPLLSQEMRRRIMERRRKSGHLSARSLLALGMREREVERLHDYAYGLEEERRDERTYTHKERRGGDKKILERRRELFGKLLAMGVRATGAVRISELAARGKKAHLKKEIDKLTGIDDRQRQRIRALCGF